MPSVGALRAGKAVIELSLLSTEVEKGLKRLQSKMRDFGTSLKSIGSTGLKLSGVMGGLLAVPIKLAANMEKTRAEFTALVGNAEQANKLFAEMQAFALVSPLSVKDLSDAGRRMLTAGVALDDIMPKLKQLGEIAGGDGEKLDRLALAFSQVVAKGRLMGQEANQMAESGFSPLAEISRTTGETMADLMARMEAGGITVEEVARAFQTATSEGGRFKGLLAAIGGTAIGQFNQLKESLTLAITPIGDALLPLIKKYLADVQKLVPQIAAWVKENGETIRTVAKLTVVVMAASAAIVAAGTVVSAITVLFNPWVLGILAVTGAYFALDKALDNVNKKLGTQIDKWDILAPQHKAFEKFWQMLGLTPATPPKAMTLEERSDKAGVALAPDKGPDAAPMGAPAPATARGESKGGIFGAIKGVLGQGMVEARAAAMRAQFEALPIRGMVEQAKLAFEKGRELAEEAQRLDDDIARERINGMQDGLAKEKALIELEKQIRLRELQEAGQLTPEMQKKLDALFGAQMANAGLDLGGRVQEQQAIFDTRFAGQIFGGKNDELEQLRMIARNTDPRNQRNNGGGLAVV